MLSKLDLPGTVWLASDIHLGPDSPETARAFLTFLSQARQHASALLLGGDIFNVWVGDDLADTPPPWLAPLLNALAATGQDIPLYVCRGNRDFLIGPALCKRIHATLLADQTLLATDAGLVLFSHGDEYCTDDHAYQRFRAWVRRPWVQRIFLAFSLKQRLKWAGYARQRSMQANAWKPSDIMDVNPEAVLRAFSAAQVDTMVHGHTHRAALHHLTAEGRALTRAVLPDWDYETPEKRGGWLEISAEGLRLRELPAT